MFEKTLQVIGLTPNEAKIYESLLRMQSANISTIAIKSKVHRRNVYDSMSKLIDKGIVSELVLENEKHFKAVDPKRLMGLLKEKESILGEALPGMQRLFQQIETKEQAYVYKGIQGFRNYMQDILDVGEDVYAVAAKGGWWDPRLAAFRKRFYKELTRKKIRVFHLFDYRTKHLIREVAKVHKHEAKFLPMAYETTSAIDIFGDHVVTFTGLGFGKLEDDLTQFVLISRKLADSYRTWFRFMWDSLP